MEPGTLGRIIAVVCLICCSAFFSSSETALTTASRFHLRALADEGSKKAAKVLKVTEDQGKMLSAILIGNNIANIVASSLVTSITIDLFGNAAVGVATGVLTVIVLIFCEITPKNMATLRAERIAMRFAPVIWVLMVILTPVIRVINVLAFAVIRLLGADPNAAKKDLTEKEIRTIMDVGHETGVIEGDEKEMIDNVFDFGDTLARELMVPRIDMTFVQADMTYDELLALFKKERHTRLPVYEESTDHVIGILNMKDLLLAKEETFSLRGILRRPFFTYETKNTAELFLEMRSNSISMAIVLDEYGTTAGLITLEDLLEEIVGDIHDEYDYDEEEPLQKLADNRYLVNASINLDDLNDALGLSLESGDYDSLGGFLIGELDHLPRLHESILTGEGIYMEVIAKEKNRIQTILLRLPGEPAKKSPAEA